MVRLRYCQEITLNAASGAPAVHVFRANSIYDPDYTTTGHQPANHDTWATIYDHYTVVGAKITARYTPTVTTSNVPAFLGVALTDSGTETAGSSTEDLLERKLVNSRYRSVGLHENGTGFVTVRHKFSAKKFFGKPNSSIINDGLYRGKLNSGNPTEGAFFEIFCTSVGGNDPGNMPILVTIDYIVVLNEPKTELAS